MSFDIALSGINAINSQLDSISNNIANSGTFGYKSSRTNFSSMYAGSQATGAEASSRTQSIDVGGSVLTTGRAMDVSIQGRGFFVSRGADGAMLYSRVGIFSVDKNGYVADAEGRHVQGYAAATTGTTTLGAMGDLRVPTGQIPAVASDSVKYVGNLSSDWTTPSVAFDHTVPGDPSTPIDPGSFNSSLVSTVYDSLGASHTLTQYFVKTGTNTVDVYYTVDGADMVSPPAPVTQLVFGANGQVASLNGTAAPVPAPADWKFPQSALPAFALGNGAAALDLRVDYNGTTQFAGESTTTVNAANGYASGTLIGVQIDNNGAVVANYSNGQKQTVGTIALATFPDEGSLAAVSGSGWVTTNASGTPLYFAPGSGMAGSLTSGALEQSNVDITGELVSLMSAQRNYQANSKVISTESQMIQALMQAV